MEAAVAGVQHQVLSLFDAAQRQCGLGDDAALAALEAAEAAEAAEAGMGSGSTATTVDFECHLRSVRYKQGRRRWSLELLLFHAQVLADGGDFAASLRACGRAWRLTKLLGWGGVEAGPGAAVHGLDTYDGGAAVGAAPALPTHTHLQAACCPLAFLQAARAHMAVDDAAQAERHLGFALRLQPHSSAVWLELGTC